MTFKKFALLHLQIYFVLVTLIFAASIVVGIVYAPEENLRYSQLVGPFITAGLCVLPSFVTYFKKEPSVKQYIARSAVQIILIECIVFYMILPPAGTNAVTFRIILGVIVFVIYFVTKLMIWTERYLQSQKLTDMLKKMQSAE